MALGKSLPLPGLAVLRTTRELDVWASPSTPSSQDCFNPGASFTPMHLPNPVGLTGLDC